MVNLLKWAVCLRIDIDVLPHLSDILREGDHR